MEYTEIKEQQRNELNNFPMFFAFNKNQFEKGMHRLGVLDKGELARIPAGGFIRKSDGPAFRALLDKHIEEMDEAMQDREFLIDALAYELNNHEYDYTHDPEPALKTLGISLDNEMHNECFQVAHALVMQASSEI